MALPASRSSIRGNEESLRDRERHERLVLVLRRGGNRIDAEQIQKTGTYSVISNLMAVNTYQLECRAGRIVKVALVGLGDNGIWPHLQAYDPDGNLLEIKQGRQGEPAVINLEVDRDGPCTLLASCWGPLE